MSSTTTTPASAPGGVFARAVSFATRHSTALAFGAIALLSIVMYAPAVSSTGFYYDDWLIQSRFGDAPSGSPGDIYGACEDPGGRPGGCLYHGTMYLLLGDSPSAYHVASIVFLIAATFLFYLLLVRCRTPRLVALLACLLWIVYPGSDATRLWPTSVGAQYILAGYVGGALLAIAALRSTGRKAIALHAVSVALFVLMLITYEVVLPFVALSGIFYWLAVRERKALLRGAADLGLAFLFLFYRLVINPVTDASGFVEQRDAGEYVDRIKLLFTSAWRSFHYLYVPVSDGVAWAMAIFAIALVGAALALRPASRRLMARWFLLLGLGLLFAAAAMISYTTANDGTVPSIEGIVNRFNVGAAPAYAVIAAALTAILWQAVRAFTGRGPAIAALVAIPVVAVSWSMASVSFDHQDAYAASWDEQRTALAGLKAASRDVPEHASVIGFGTPAWEIGYVPVFSASWDLRGALDERTRLDPDVALPYLEGLECGRDGVRYQGQPFAPYGGASPVFFMNAKLRQSRRIAGEASCRQTLKAWGAPIFWGKTVTG